MLDSEIIEENPKGEIRKEGRALSVPIPAADFGQISAIPSPEGTCAELVFSFITLVVLAAFALLGSG